MTGRSEFGPPKHDQPLERGERLRAAREFLQRTQEEMGELLGLSGRSWHEYEKGTTIPKVPVYEMLADLGVEPRFLTSGKGSPDPASGWCTPPEAEPPPGRVPEDEDEVEELMRALSYPAEIRLHGSGKVSVQLVMTAAMQYAKTHDWSPEQLARLARFSRILEGIIEQRDDERRAQASGRRDTRAD